MERETGITFRLGDVTWHYWNIDGDRFEWRSSCQRFRVWREGHQVLASCDGRPAQSQRTLRAAMIFAQHEGILRDHGFQEMGRVGQCRQSLKLECSRARLGQRMNKGTATWSA